MTEEKFFTIFPTGPKNDAYAKYFGEYFKNNYNGYRTTSAACTSAYKNDGSYCVARIFDEGWQMNY